MTTAMTLRLGDDLAADLRLVACLEGVSIAVVAREAIGAHVRAKLGEPCARARLAAMQDADRRRLERGGL